MKKLLITQPVTIVANGNFPKHHIPLEILNKANCIIACDGGADTLVSNGYEPDIIIGDLDSISNENKLKFSDRLVKKIISVSENGKNTEALKIINKIFTDD